MQALFTLSATIYLLFYAFEGALRYGLYNVGLNSAILLRDGLLIVPLAVLFVTQALRLRIHPAFYVFGGIIALHGTIATLNIHSALPAIYGAKLLVNVLFGFIVSRQLTQPGRRLAWLFALVWLISVTGVALDKFVYTMPWMGLETNIGGIQVDVSRGWDIDGGFDKRAAGLFRSSISAAMLLPTLALLIAPRLRSWTLRLLFLAVTCGAVALTTQKGALVAAAVVSLLLCMPLWSRYSLLCMACIAFAVVDVALPIFSVGLVMPANGGVFSFASFAMRISRTWPEAWGWITSHDVFPFGVGLGGIGGAQRFYAPDFFNPSDNLFVFLYANFGLLGLFYLGWLSRIGRRLPEELHTSAVPALAVLAFNIGYGAALSMLEDQISALFIGAAAGMLWQLHQTARAGQWSDAYRGDPVRAPPGVSAGYAAAYGRPLSAR
jgi:hypothetical protein